MSKYNLKTKKEKHARYRDFIRAELVDDLYDKIFQKVIAEKRYRDPYYSAKKLAIDLSTNTRYISAVISLRFDQNYTGLVNEYRIKDALYFLRNRRYKEFTMEEIGLMVGFSTRQAFYISFYRKVGCSPLAYRKDHLPEDQ